MDTIGAESRCLHPTAHAMARESFCFLYPASTSLDVTPDAEDYSHYTYTLHTHTHLTRTLTYTHTRVVLTQVMTLVTPDADDYPHYSSTHTSFPPLKSRDIPYMIYANPLMCAHSHRWAPTSRPPVTHTCTYIHRTYTHMCTHMRALLTQVMILVGSNVQAPGDTHMHI